MKNIINRLFMSFKRACLFAAGVLCFVTVFAGSAFAGNITNMRIGQQVGSVRIVLEADSKPEYQAFLLSEPKRLVVDVYNMNVKRALQSDKNNLIKQTRIGKLNGNDKRIVFDLQKPAFIKKAFVLSPQGNGKWRFVVDVALCSERDFNAKVGTRYAFSSAGAGSQKKTETDRKSVV